MTPTKEAMEKARQIAERQFIEPPTESEQNFVDSIVPEFALEFTNYQKQLNAAKSLSICSKHEYPYGVDPSGECGEPICVWCEKNRADAYQKRIEELEKELQQYHEITYTQIKHSREIQQRLLAIEEKLKSHLAKGVKEG